MEDEQGKNEEAHVAADDWLESTNTLTGKRVCFRIQDATRAEEGDYGGTKIIYRSGESFEIALDYDDFTTARRLITGGDTLGKVEVENQN